MIQQIAIQQAPVIPKEPAESGKKEDSKSFEAVLQQAVGATETNKGPKADEKKPSESGKEKDVVNDAPEQTCTNGLMTALLLLQQMQPAQTDLLGVASGTKLSADDTALAGIDPLTALAAETPSLTGSLLPLVNAETPALQSAGIPLQEIAQPVQKEAMPELTQSVAAALTAQNKTDAPKQQSTEPIVLEQNTPKAGRTEAPTGVQQPLQNGPTDSTTFGVSSRKTVSNSNQQISTQLPETKIPAASKISEQTEAVNQNTVAFQHLLQDGNVVVQVSGTKEPKAQGTAFHQIAAQVTHNHQAGNSQFQMDLFPKDLGKVSVKMAMEKGMLVVEIAAENPKTQSMLASSSGEIRSLLESAVGQPVQVMQTSPENSYYQQQRQDSSESGQQQEQAKQNQQNSEDNNNAEDFLTVMQQLRVKNSIV